MEGSAALVSIEKEFPMKSTSSLTGLYGNGGLHR
jgi:hypothetical protein